MGAARVRCAGARLWAALVVFILAVCAWAALPLSAYAGSPAVVASSPEAGEEAAPAQGRYWVQFENAVASVEANAGLIVLETADGKAVSKKLYSVSLPDMELEFGYRQYVWIDVDGLKADTAYRIHVLPGVTAKNGMVNPDETFIDFKTALSGKKATALAEPGAVEGGSGNGNGTGGGNASGATQAQEPSQPGNSPGVDSSQDGQGVVSAAEGEAVQSEPLPVGVIVGVGIALLLVALALVFDVQRRKKNVTRR